MAEAIRYWEPIYRELGAAKGYRLAFNLARAHETYGDFTRAAEFYEAFLAEVDARRRRDVATEPIVEKEATEARARLKELTSTKGRIQVHAGAKPVSVRIDAAESRVSGFVAFVPPGTHVVILGAAPDDPERREVTVGAGEIVEITPAAAPPPVPREEPRVLAPRASKVQMEHRVEHPFSPAILYVAGGATLASVVLPVLAYESALSVQRTSKLSSDPGGDAANAAVRADYRSASRTYYVTLAVPITLAAVTGGLAAWYFFGTKERDVPVLVPGLGPTAGGAAASLSGRF